MFWVKKETGKNSSKTKFNIILVRKESIISEYESHRYTLRKYR